MAKRVEGFMITGYKISLWDIEMTIDKKKCCVGNITRMDDMRTLSAPQDKFETIYPGIFK
jgi:hypothetical protein